MGFKMTFATPSRAAVHGWLAISTLLPIAIGSGGTVWAQEGERPARAVLTHHHLFRLVHEIPLNELDAQLP